MMLYPSQQLHYHLPRSILDGCIVFAANTRKNLSELGKSVSGFLLNIVWATCLQFQESQDLPWLFSVFVECTVKDWYCRLGSMDDGDSRGSAQLDWQGLTQPDWWGWNGKKYLCTDYVTRSRVVISRGLGRSVALECLTISPHMYNTRPISLLPLNRQMRSLEIFGALKTDHTVLTRIYPK